MQSILSSLRELEGVNGALVADGVGQIYASVAAAIYDASLLSQVSKSIATAMDSIKLIQEDWETITVQFSEGRIILRSIPSSQRKEGSGYVLVLVSDGRINLSFATVAIRVAVGKLKALVDSHGGTLPVMAGSAGVATAPLASSGASAPKLGYVAAAAPPVTGLGTSQAHTSSSDVAGSGLSWSGLGGSSTMTASGVAVADAASSAVLTACTKCLAKAVGPMAKVFVKDAVRQVTAGQPFSKSMLAQLIAEVEKHIEDREDAAQFRKSASKLT